MYRLKLRLEPDSDGTGELFLEVMANRFGGIGCAYARLGEIDALGKALSTHYPLQTDMRYGIEGPYPSRFSLRFYPLGPTGKIGCRVLLGSPLTDGDRPDAVHSVTLEFHPEYEALRSFGFGLQAMAAGQITELLLQDEFAETPDWMAWLD